MRRNRSREIGFEPDFPGKPVTMAYEGAVRAWTIQEN